MKQLIIRSAFVIAGATLLNPWPTAGSAQGSAAPAGVPQDSLLDCAVRLATAAGFRVAPGRRPNRIGLMRPRDGGGSTYPMDGLRLSLAAPDTGGAMLLKVDLKTFVVSRATGLNQGEVTPSPALTALADSMRQRCRTRS